MNQTSASTSKAVESKPAEQKQDPLYLGVLEEDDEFEEFVVAGQLVGYGIVFSDYH